MIAWRAVFFFCVEVTPYRSSCLCHSPSHFYSWHISSFYFHADTFALHLWHISKNSHCPVIYDPLLRIKVQSAKYRAHPLQCIASSAEHSLTVIDLPMTLVVKETRGPPRLNKNCSLETILKVLIQIYICGSFTSKKFISLVHDTWTNLQLGNKC